MNARKLSSLLVLLALVVSLAPLPGLAQAPQAEPESLSGSYVAFDPSVGGDACYVPGQSQTFCFRAESFTGDHGWVSSQFQRFPADWAVHNVYVQGTPYCDNGGLYYWWGWQYHTYPNEVLTVEARGHATVDHCVAYYCYEVMTGNGGLSSWYWSGDDWGNPPYHPCSSDVYTPSGLPACDEAIHPQASIPLCPMPDIVVTPPSLDSEQCADTIATQTLQVCNNGDADLTWSLGEAPPGKVEWQAPVAAGSQGAHTVHGPANPGVDPAAVPQAPKLTGTVLLDQQPTHMNGWFSDAGCDECEGPDPVAGTLSGGQVVAENFSLEHVATLEQIVLWSGYYPTDTPIDPDVIRVVIHQDAPGRPGAVVYDDSNVAYTRVQTGVVLFDILHEWMHTLTLGTPATLPAGTWWVEIYNDTGWGTDDWFWEEGYPDTYGRGLPYCAQAYEAPGVAWHTLDLDLAMQLIGTEILWLSEDPTSGTVPPGECADVTVTFDSTGMAPGDYLGSLLIGSNDPDTPVVTVPVQMTVLSCCEPPSNVEFSWDPAQPLVNQDITFTGTAQGSEPLDYTWDFGDGGGGSGGTVTHAYAQAGTYLVTMTATNGCGQQVVTHEVVVASGCEPVHDAAFTWDPAQPYAGQAVTFNGTAQGSEPIDYIWSFGDGGSANGTTVTHTFAATGRYRVTMTASNGCGQQVVRQALKVVDPPRWMHVGWIQLAAEPGPGGKYVLRARVEIVDDEGAVVPGATVYVAWTDPVGGVTTQSARTNKLGEAAVKTQTRLTGEWELCVTDVVKTGWTYDPDSNVATCEPVTVP